MGEAEAGATSPVVYAAPSYTPPVSAVPPAASNAVLSSGQCSGSLNVPVGSAPTSFGVSSYVNSANCIWNLQASSQVSLTFSSFNTESGYDFVYVFDGASTSSALMGTFSGSTIPSAVRSSGASMTVQFSSDGSVTAQGFAALASAG